ncbi:bifunctional serine/threonine-protein kinase/formylglycine-generating enzyme family protein [Synechocystis sp. PCC 7338]|uniref:bifunctional serine/threonine-protein kinase/formylglycine-generating enzyme family protein n=1 Tax=Synechocystis sp. PCC 7338 TaxID=2732530 RepID=UPI001BAF1FFF|nr:bifunctional serine/threonine-protein kinase/formylglycine-generating enzyme family protein [Synechocystis sp. PCC 7338]QUS60498.1 SUMF1/EgtB/PvdO family nonheme iron enzyme [Synechocystis sp. PCC 7338]
MNQSQCLNPNCLAVNSVNHRFCQKCGQKLWLKDRYQALQLIGQGGFGKTFLAVDLDKPSQPRCVIKQFFPQGQETGSLGKAAELFREEAKRLDELGHHAQIPELLAYFIADDQRQYLVQEYVEGNNLAQELIQQGVFNETKIRALLLDLLSVLDFIHNHQVIHRDIKPENIIRRQSNQKLVLVDFGVSKFVDQSSGQTQGTIVGSTGYMAPEQLQGKAIYASDFYGLGATCLHLLTGQLPTNLYDANEGKWLWQNYLVNNEVSSNLVKVLNKLVEYTPNRRYESVESILSVLEYSQKKNWKWWGDNNSNPPSNNNPVQQIQEIPDNKTVIQFPGLMTLTFEFETLQVNANGIVVTKRKCVANCFRQNLNSETFLEMVLIPSGIFMMGAPAEEKDSLNWEKPQHKVTIPAFWMSKYPVTQAQWKKIMGNNPSRFRGENKPVEKVSWEQCQQYCKILSEKTQKQFRLPSEAEWEYACRAGTNNEFYCGQTINCNLANYDCQYSYKGENSGTFINQTTDVGKFPANGFGLYDMCGNVWEWCQDNWHSSYQNAPASEKPWIDTKIFGSKDKKRVRRGGSWRNKPSYCRSSSRSSFEQDCVDITLSFRLVMENIPQ